MTTFDKIRIGSTFDFQDKHGNTWIHIGNDPIHVRGVKTGDNTFELLDGPWEGERQFVDEPETLKVNHVRRNDK